MREKPNIPKKPVSDPPPPITAGDHSESAKPVDLSSNQAEVESAVVAKHRRLLMQNADPNGVVILEVPRLWGGGGPVKIRIEVESALLFVDGRGIRLAWNSNRNCAVSSQSSSKRPTASIAIGRKFYPDFPSKVPRTIYLDGDHKNLTLKNLRFDSPDGKSEEKERPIPQPTFLETYNKWRIIVMVEGKQVQRRFNTAQEAEEFRDQCLRTGKAPDSKIRKPKIASILNDQDESEPDETLH